MNIFVTGANGFVGQHLTTRLIDAGHAVSAAVRRHGSAPLGTREVIVSDIGPTTVWDGLLANHDVVIHLAARVHIMHDVAKDPLIEFRRVNTEGTAVLARAAAEQGVSTFVFLSSIKVNGEATQGRAFTAHDQPRPKDPYGVSKLYAEQILREIERESGMAVVIVRSPLVYGPRVAGNFAKTLDLTHRGIPLPLGSIDNRRTMVSVWNLADLLEASASDARAAGALVLAGDIESPSTAHLFRSLSSAMGTKSRLFRFPVALLLLAGKLTNRTQVVQRLTGSLDVQSGSSSTDWRWNASFSFEESIRRTVAWYLEDLATNSRVSDR